MWAIDVNKFGNKLLHVLEPFSLVNQVRCSAFSFICYTVVLWIQDPT